MKKSLLKKSVVFMLTIVLLSVLCSCKNLEDKLAAAIEDFNDNSAANINSNSNKMIPSTDENGVMLAFEGDYVYLEIHGDALIEAAKNQSGDAYNQGYVNFLIGTSKPYASSKEEIKIDPNDLKKSLINEYIYETSDGETGLARLLYFNQKRDKISLWFYAPGFEDDIKGEEYCLETMDEDHHFNGVNGTIDDILGDFPTLVENFPEIPEEFDITYEEIAEIFGPMLTPNYLIIQCEYNYVPVSSDFDWYLNETTGSYDYMAGKLAYNYDEPATQVEFVMYDFAGYEIKDYTKCIYGSETAAVTSRINYLEPIKTADEPYGTEADYEQWRYEYLTSSPGFYLHKGNIVYFDRYGRYISDATDMYREFDEYTKDLMNTVQSSAPFQRLESGKFNFVSFDDKYEDDRGEIISATIGGTGRYKVYCSFDMDDAAANDYY